MPYATEADYKKQFCEREAAELSNIDTAVLSSDRSRITETIPKAESEVNMILADRYKTPVKGCSYLNWATLVITRKMLHSNDKSEAVIRDYEDVIERLRELVLVGDDGVPIPTLSGEIGGDDNSIKYYSGKMYSGSRDAPIPGLAHIRGTGYRSREYW